MDNLSYRVGVVKPNDGSQHQRFTETTTDELINNYTTLLSCLLHNKNDVPKLVENLNDQQFEKLLNTLKTKCIDDRYFFPTQTDWSKLRPLVNASLQKVIKNINFEPSTKPTKQKDSIPTTPPTQEKTFLQTIIIPCTSTCKSCTEEPTVPLGQENVISQDDLDKLETFLSLVEKFNNGGHENYLTQVELSSDLDYLVKLETLRETIECNEEYYYHLYPVFNKFIPHRYQPGGESMPST
jgi:hypothetical protein